LICTSVSSLAEKRSKNEVLDQLWSDFFF